MSMTKKYYEDQIEALARQTGYNPAFLLDIWHEELATGDGDFEYFCAVTLEHDW